MLRVEYYHADTGELDYFYRTSKERAGALLDKWVDNGDDPLRRVTAFRVDWKGGDYARVVDLDPLCPMMREGYGEPADPNDPDRIFDE